jgi:hypothetical protein
MAVAMLFAYFSETFRVRRAAVGVVLDGSRRWVTLSRVSDVFASSVPDTLAERHF